MKLFPFWRHKKRDPLTDKVLEIVGGRFTNRDAQSLIEFVRSFQSDKGAMSEKEIQDRLSALRLTYAEFNAIWKYVSMDTKFGLANYDKHRFSQKTLI